MTRWVLRLIVANVLVFIVSSASPGVAQAFALVPARILLQPWTLITYMFLHANFAHIFFNMLALFFFGPRLEYELGEKNFVLLYFASGISGGLLSFFFMPYTPIIGASGAVYGIMLGFAYYWPRERIFIYGILPVQARILVIVMTALSLYGGLGLSSDNVAHFAHLGGFLGGYLFLRLTDRRSRIRHPVVEQAAPVREEDFARWKNIPRDRLHQVNREELDRIMAKLSSGGVDSLTLTERSFLDRFSSQ
jgi:membrane associated rhomboid family serine protease